MNSNGCSNQWVLCESRRFPEKTYFFNVLTGDAVWNSSDDISNRKSLNANEVVLNTEYPEPKEAMHDSLSATSDGQVPAAMCNTINNSVANLNFSQCHTLGCPIGVHSLPRNWNDCKQTGTNNTQHQLVHAHSCTSILPERQKVEYFTLPPENEITPHNQYDVNAPARGSEPTKSENYIDEDKKKAVKTDLQKINNLNIVALQNFFKIDVKTKVWFLVLDEVGFLKYLNLIKDIRHADKRCRLVVPECVLKCIQNATTSVNKVLMKRALQAAVFISNVLSENCAIVDKENPCEDHNQNIIACCRKYSEKDFKVVLIIKNKTNVNDINCPVFEVKEINQIFNKIFTKHKPEINESKRTSVRSEMGAVRNVSEYSINENNIKEENTVVSGSYDKPSVAINGDKNVMFEVTSEVMQENLVSKSEEWISRFTQTMEEVLNQILQKADFNSTPPPWTMYEACECIKRGFKNDDDIVDAANKLGDIIFDNGALRGKINHNVNPWTFMKIYSYGVYLIDSLQSVFEDDDNLQTAEKLLTKLLADIETPDFNNSFSEIDVSRNEHDEVALQKSPHKEQSTCRITRSKAKYITSLSVQEQTNQSETKILHFLPGKDNFLANFQLKNVDSDESLNKSINSVNSETDEPPIMRPKIIRNFTRVSKLEDKLDANRSQDECDLDFILDGAKVPDKTEYTYIDFIEQTKAKLGYVFKFCNDTRLMFLKLQNFDKKDVNSRAKTLAKLINFYRLQLRGIYEREKDVFINDLHFTEAEYTYNREFVKHCLDECAVLNAALSIIILDTK